MYKLLKIYDCNRKEPYRKVFIKNDYKKHFKGEFIDMTARHKNCRTVNKFPYKNKLYDIDNKVKKIKFKGDYDVRC